MSSSFEKRLPAAESGSFFNAKHIEALACTHYFKTNPKGRRIFQLIVSDEASKVVDAKGFGSIRQVVEEEIQRVSADRFGSTSIDPGKQAREARLRRSIKGYA